MVESAFSDERARLIEMVHGYRATCIIVAALECGLFDALSAASVGEEALADRLAVHPPSLRRLLRALCALGLT
jgi:hypothetical protein